MDRRIVVTRDEAEDGALSSLLREAGAVPVLRPTMEVAALHDPHERRARMPDPASARWLIVTSSRTLEFLAEVGWFDGLAPAGLRVAAVGPRTAEALAAHDWTPELVPERAGAAPLVNAILARDPTAGGTVILPVSARADDRIPEALRAAGYTVLRVDLYAPRSVPQDPAWWRARLSGSEALDALTFTSPSAVSGLTDGLDDPETLDRLRRLPAGVQGPTTAEAAGQAGWRRRVEADPRTFAGLVEALGRHFAAPVPPPSSPTPP